MRVFVVVVDVNLQSHLSPTLDVKYIVLIVPRNINEAMSKLEVPG
jgi:hypothetical protein